MKKLKNDLSSRVAINAEQHVSRLRALLKESLSYRALEQRIAFDAAAAQTAEQVTDGPGGASFFGLGGDVGHAQQTGFGQDPLEALADAVTAVEAETTSGSVIIVIDSSVADIDVFLEQIDSGAEIIILDGERDGVEQIAEALAGRSNIDAIHIISHGTEGSLNLGNTTLTAASMQGEHLDELTIIGEALSADGDILIYGCDYTAGDAGLEAAMILGGITGADIAASSDLTGAAALGGDWELETTIGGISAEAIAVVEWNGLLTPSSATHDWATSSNLIQGNTVNYPLGGITNAMSITVSGTGVVFGNSVGFGDGGTGDTVQVIQGNTTSTTVGQLVDIVLNSAALPNGANSVSFNVGNIDASSGGWDDRIIVQAYDINGVLLSGADITAVPLSTVNQTYTITANANSQQFDGNIDGPSDSDPGDTVQLTITSTTGANVGRVTVLYVSGTAGVTTGAVALSDIAVTYDLPPEIDLDTTDAGPVVAGPTITDTFETNTYSGGSGWTGSWVETGETTSTSAGDIRLVSDGGDLSVRITDADNGVDTIQRAMDLSGETSATLTYDFRNGGLDGTAETVSIQISSDGVNFTTLATYDGNSSTAYTSFSHDISAFISANTTVRITASTALEASDFGYFDNIQITSSHPGPEPTSYATTYTTNTAPVGIAGVNVGITDANDTNIQSATITLTNAQSGDLLSVLAALPGGITASAYNPATGVITLTGSATLADYQTAIEFVGFSSSSTSGADRTINVTVNDGTSSSNTAVSTIVITLDTDGDGVIDSVDIDDDNDGIIDSNEMSLVTSAPVTSTLAYDAAASTAASQVNGQPVIILTDGNVTVTITNNFGATISGNSVTTNSSSGAAESIRITATSPAGAVLIQGLQFIDLDNFDPNQFVDALAIDQAGSWGGLGNANGLDALVSYSLDAAGEAAATAATNETVTFSGLISAGAVSPVLLNPASTVEDNYFGTFTFNAGVSSFLVFGTDVIAPLDQVTTFTFTTFPITYTIQSLQSVDSDSDGVSNHLDIDSDNDGITDNVEAQTTDGYIAPSGVDTDGDGLDDAYDATPTTGPMGSNGLTPIDTDGADAVDYLDVDSDNDGTADIAERGDGAPTSITSTTDTDGDGLLDIFEGASVTDGFDVNDENLSGTTFNLADTDNDTAANGAGAVPLVNDLDYRDANEPPVAVDDVLSTNEDTPLVTNIITANGIDSDPDSDPLTIVSATIDWNGDGSPDVLTLGAPTAMVTGTGQAIGVITLQSNGDLTFAPAANYNGPVPTLTYTLSDGNSQTDTANVDISVSPVNDAPVSTPLGNLTNDDADVVSVDVS
ncbi:MAG: DUF4347 domain-containing protein, partial [Hyphomicrobiaceae bacterium]|nr:DUF4347 domain-containing protein [Hyphomicrobiaceae bacterium]